MHIKAGGRTVEILVTTVHELMEERDEKRLLRLQRQLAGYKLLIIDLCCVRSYVE